MVCLEELSTPSFITYIKLCFVILFAMASGTSTFKSDQLARKLSQTNTDFALHLYRHLPGFQKGDNIFFSPFSISAVMSMVYMGARGNTAKEMEEVLKIIPIKDVLHLAFNDYLRLLEDPNSNFTLSTANRVYSQMQANISESFKSDCKEYYNAEPVTVDFMTEAENVRQQINAWVESQTNNKIRDLIAQGVLDSMTRIVIVNAIYFKGDWASKFNPKLTKKMPFYIKQDESIDVDMMIKKKKFRHGESKEMKCDLLELPYKGEELSMVILLPRSTDGLSSVEEALTPTMLHGIQSLLGFSDEIKVIFPKFKLETSFDLEEALSLMGMKDLFVPYKADLTGIDDSKQLHVSKVIHKAFVEVNEEGTEAAAATAAIISLNAMPSKPKEFRVDRPFMFLIYDKRPGTVLFAGRLVRPDGVVAKIQSSAEGKNEL